MADDWISIAEASKQTGYSVYHLQYLLRERKVEGRKVVTVWLVSRSSLADYLQKQSEWGKKRGRKPRAKSSGT